MTANSLFLKGNLTQTPKFMRKVWFSGLDEPLCVPRDVSTTNWDPYAGNRENCDIFDVDQSDPSQWNGGYQTFQIAVNKISINFVKEKLPTEAKEILITVNNNIKPKKKSISFFDYPCRPNKFSKFCIFHCIFIPSVYKDNPMLVSETYFNVDASKNPKFHTVDIHIQSIDDVQTIEFSCFELSYPTGNTKNIKDDIDSFVIELIICNEAWKMYYEANNYFDEVHME